LQFRFAFHELLDAASGLPSLSELEFGHFQFKYFENELNLQQLSLIRMLQLNPIHRLESTVSWGVDIGMKNMPTCFSGDSCLGTGIQIFGGYAFGDESHTLWLLPFLNYKYGRQFKHDENYLAIGYQLGYLLPVSQRVKLLVKYEKEVPNRYQIQDLAIATGRYNFKSDQAIDVQWSESNTGGNAWARHVRINYHYFF
jgi:hypothetical protein